MQKTEKHCKNQCFCYHKTTKISPKTGPKTQKSASGPATCGTAKKDVANQKIEVKKLKNTVFFTFRLPILDGRVHEQVSSVLFFTVFFEGERHDLSKTGGFGRKMPPPPGKPATFYECHPEDHAPAPSVRADLTSWETVSIHFGGLFWGSLIWWGCDHLCYTAKAEKANDLFLAPAGSVTWLIFAGRAPAVTCTHTDDRYVYMIYDTHTHAGQWYQTTCTCGPINS